MCFSALTPLYIQLARCFLCNAEKKLALDLLASFLRSILIKLQDIYKRLVKLVS